MRGWLASLLCVRLRHLLLVSLQACRGHALDDGVEVDSATDASAAAIFQQYLSVPVDTVVMYATAPGASDSLSTLVTGIKQDFKCCGLPRVSSLDVESYHQH